jgi:transcriptional regulator with XRE-family HTH domain
MQYRLDGAELRRRRLAKGLRPAVLAVAVDRTEACIRQYELDQSNPPLSILSELCNLLDCEPSDLLVAVEQAS